MPVEVLCIGHAAYDVSVFVDGYPAENSKCETQVLIEACGGPAANAAWLLSHWGMSCAFAGLVGDDVYGRRIHDEFEAAGTDVSLLELRQGHATPLSTILINQRNASRTIVNRKLKGAAYHPDAAFMNAMKPGFLLFDGHELDASLAALETFPQAVSILDAGSWREGTAALAGRVNYLAASERFALQATGLSALENEEQQRSCLEQLRQRFGTTVIVTLGDRGLGYDDGGGFRAMPAFAVQAVDTTAAGDIFHGALVYAISRQKQIEEALRFASLTASLSVQKAGGRTSIPALHEVTEALACGD